MQIAYSLHPRTRRPDAGFSLVELLVVISIIAILIALMIPAISKAKYSAQLLTCKNTIRQVGAAAINYAVNNKGWYPYNMVSNRQDAGGISFPGEREMLYYRNQGNFNFGGSIAPPDSRPLWRPYIPINLMFCPFTKPGLNSPNPDAAGTAPTDIIYSNYEYWCGAQVTNLSGDTDRTDGQFRVDQTMRFGGLNYSVLVADFDRYVPGAGYNASHPDTRGIMTVLDLTTLSNRYYGIWYTKAGTTFRGLIDRNFAMSDGSAKTIYNVISHNSSVTDPRFTRMPNSPAGVGYYVYLPFD